MEKQVINFGNLINRAYNYWTCESDVFVWLTKRGAHELTVKQLLTFFFFFFSEYRGFLFKNWYKSNLNTHHQNIICSTLFRAHLKLLFFI